MTYIFLDESGDLGFDFSKAGTSNQFLVSFLIADNKRPVSSLVRKVFASLPKSTKHKNSGILHASYEKSSTIKKLLANLANKDIKVAAMRLDKRKVLIAGDPHDLYADIVVALVNHLYADGVIDNRNDVTLVASRRDTSKSLNERFSKNVVNNASCADFAVDIVKPGNDKCLQAADFVSWAFWQKYEKSNSVYADLLVDKIVREYNMYD